VAKIQLIPDLITGKGKLQELVVQRIYRHTTITVFNVQSAFSNSQHKFNTILAYDCPQKKKEK
jgi:hypothetical protein